MRQSITAKGYTVIAYVLPLNEGELHRFSDDSHAKNFLRYLFSKSKAHPVSERTALNLLRETGPGDASAYLNCYNANPDAMLADFARRRFPAGDAARRLADDCCYIIFMAKCPDGEVITNLFTEEKGILHLDHPLLGELLQSGIEEETLQEDVAEMFESTAFRRIEEDLPAAKLKPVETILHFIARQSMGRAKDVILSVTHRDQVETNPLYHIHCLVTLD